MNCKLLFSALCITLISFAAQAQPAYEWARRMGGVRNVDGTNSAEVVNDIKKTADGHYIAIGTVIDGKGNVTGFKEYDRSSFAYAATDLWIVKLDDTGAIVWNRAYGGSRNDNGVAIIPLADGSFVAAGNSASSDSDLLQVVKPNLNTDLDLDAGTGDTLDIWIFRINGDGSIDWQKSFGGSGQDILQDMKPLPDGGYILSGITVSDDGIFADNHGLQDVFLVKINARGDIEWHKCYGGSGQDAYLGRARVTVLADGSLVVAATTESSDGDLSGLTPQGGRDFWVFRTDASGNIQWSSRYGGSSDDVVSDITPAGDGGFLIVGQSQSTDGDIQHPEPGGRPFAWLLKLDSMGAYQWDRGYGGSSGQAICQAYSVAGTIDEGFLISGFASGDGGTIINRPFSGRSQGWIFKTDAEGNITWMEFLGYPNSSSYLQVAMQHQDGSFVTGGNAGSGSLSSGKPSITGTYRSQDYDWVIAKIEACPYYTHLSDTICKGDIYSFTGRELRAGGIYYDTTGHSASGCDSLIRLTLWVDSVAKPVITSEGNFLETDPGYSSYQWLDEQLNPISGAEGAGFEAEPGAGYYVRVTGANGCTDTSDMFELSYTITGQFTTATGSKVFPNPASGRIYVDIPGLSGQAGILLTAADGKTVYHTETRSARTVIPLDALPYGYYLLRIQNNEGTAWHKILNVPGNR